MPVEEFRSFPHFIRGKVKCRTKQKSTIKSLDVQSVQVGWLVTKSQETNYLSFTK